MCNRQSQVLGVQPTVQGKLPIFEERNLWKRSEEHTSELQSRQYLVCRLLLEKKPRLELIEIPKGLIEVLQNSGFTIEKILDSEPSEIAQRSEEHTSELHSRQYLVCRLLLENK